MRTVTISEARTHLSRLVREAAAGESFVVTKDGKALFRIDALPKSDESRSLDNK